MISLQKRSSGFTIVELLIVIIVIGILATLVIVTFTGIQQKARDSKRQTDINALDSHLEAFYASNGYYPAYTHFSDTSSGGWVATNMKGLDPNAEVDPKGGTLQNGTGDSTHYGYQAFQADGTTACDTTNETTCASFTLTAHMEKDGSTFVKKSNT